MSVTLNEEWLRKWLATVPTAPPTPSPFQGCHCGQPRGSYCRRRDCPTRLNGVELEPCAFCGSEDVDVILQVMQDRQAHQAAALCQACGAQGPVLTFEQPGNLRIAESLMRDTAANAWNTRVPIAKSFPLPPTEPPPPLAPEPEPAVEDDDDYWR